MRLDDVWWSPSQWKIQFNKSTQNPLLLKWVWIGKKFLLLADWYGNICIYEMCDSVQSPEPKQMLLSTTIQMTRICLIEQSENAHNPLNL